MSRRGGGAGPAGPVRRATSDRRVGTGRAGRLAGLCGLLTIAVSAATMAAGPGASLQPGPGVVVRELAAGKLLVAARNLPDANFTDTVVLLIEYSKGGAAGLVLNRPSRVPLSRALPGVADGGGATAFIGGPVSPESVIVLSRTTCDACRPVGRDVYLVNTSEALKALLAEGADARRLRVYAGYAGWGPGQLEAEARQGAWRVHDAGAPVVFDPDPQSLWRRLIRRTEAVLASLFRDRPGLEG